MLVQLRSHRDERVCRSFSHPVKEIVGARKNRVRDGLRDWTDVELRGGARREESKTRRANEGACMRVV